MDDFKLGSDLITLLARFLMLNFFIYLYKVAHKQR